jgi:hypothetical protein
VEEKTVREGGLLRAALLLGVAGLGGVGWRRWPRVGESRARGATGRMRGLTGAEACLRWRLRGYGGRVRGVEP